jgi:hypothetical protein
MNLKTVLSIWVAYLTPWKPFMPAVGGLIGTDCIWGQAFGRNTFSDEELGVVINAIRSRVGMDDVRTMVMLRHQGCDPGASNKALARHIHSISDRSRSTLRRPVPMMVQWEIAYALYLEHPDWYRENQQHIDCIWPPATGYFSTWHVQEQALQMMRKRGLNRPLEVAHPAMLVRAQMTSWKIGVRPFVQAVDAEIADRNNLWVWDEASIQPWTRNFQAWKKRETIGRIAHIVTHFGAWFLPLVPENIRVKIPGNWIRFTPPSK